MAGSLFSNLFGQSPIKPIQEHIIHAQACAKQLVPFLEATINNDWDKAEGIQTHINELEDKADKIKKDIRLNLPKSLWLPVNRSDLLNLVTRQDKIANRAKDRLQIQVRAALFAIEKNFSPIDIMFLYQIIEWFGDLADQAQKVGSLMQLLISQ